MEFIYKLIFALFIQTFILLVYSNEEYKFLVENERIIDTVQCEEKEAGIVKMRQERNNPLYTARFKCRIIHGFKYSKKNYEFIIKPQQSSRSDICLTCFHVEIKRGILNRNELYVIVNGRMNCGEKYLMLSYEVREVNGISLHQGVYVLEQPKTRTQLKFQRTFKHSDDHSGKVLTALFKDNCHIDNNTKHSRMLYKMRGVNCYDESKVDCTLNNLQNNWKQLRCPVNVSLNNCEKENECDVYLSAEAWGTDNNNKRTFSTAWIHRPLFMYHTGSVSISLSWKDHNTIEIKFQKPVLCETRLSAFVYRISYMDEWNLQPKIIINKSCGAAMACKVDIKDLEIATTYKVCVEYKPLYTHTEKFETNTKECSSINIA